MTKAEIQELLGGAEVAFDAISDHKLLGNDPKDDDVRKLIRDVMRNAIAILRILHQRSRPVRRHKPRGWPGKIGLYTIRTATHHVHGRGYDSENHYHCMFCRENLHTHGRGPRITAETITRMENHTALCAALSLFRPEQLELPPLNINKLKFIPKDHLFKLARMPNKSK